jgi:hypothetical protein
MIARPKLFLPRRVVARPFSVSRPRWEAAALPARKPVGAFRGGCVPILLRSFALRSAIYNLSIREISNCLQCLRLPHWRRCCRRVGLLLHPW